MARTLLTQPASTGAATPDLSTAIKLTDRRWSYARIQNRDTSAPLLIQIGTLASAAAFEDAKAFSLAAGATFEMTAEVVEADIWIKGDASHPYTALVR